YSTLFSNWIKPNNLLFVPFVTLVPFVALLISESDDRIHSRRTSGRYVAGDRRDSNEQQRYQCKRGRISRCNTKQQRGHHSRQRKRSDETNRNSRYHQFQTVTDSEFEHRTSLRTERHANADL